ncbi:hypothetical protein BCR34DRAFT_584985 [Clohesyomyces aquaticus]|uniref:Uncharacterized protein n=1 Tax=Clohesyomyces aquaticus TaxID=1231657 RepID=A0A1Y1ZZF3_9PLEO|nr:hypothetical protein BCR34DRAFT_584985 [Clohesyomyces aquaticus]
MHWHWKGGEERGGVYGGGGICTIVDMDLLTRTLALTGAGGASSSGLPRGNSTHWTWTSARQPSASGSSGLGSTEGTAASVTVPALFANQTSLAAISSNATATSFRPLFASGPSGSSITDSTVPSITVPGPFANQTSLAALRSNATVTTALSGTGKLFQPPADVASIDVQQRSEQCYPVLDIVLVYSSSSWS